MAPRPEVDVVVAGAGPAGSALAVMLGIAGLRTLLVDQCQFPRDKPCGEGLMPHGVQALERLGLDLEAHPRLSGVTYRVPGAGAVAGHFRPGRFGRGVRRRDFDSRLAKAAAATRNVEALFGCRVTRVLERDPPLVETSAGTVRARYLVGADGQRSLVARSLGWYRPPRPPHRFALVGHLDAPGHGFDRVVVTLLDGCETYVAPTSDRELLAALLGPPEGLRRPDERARDAYRRLLAEAHPDLAGSDPGTVRGAGPFATRPARAAGGCVFLLGDAAGFLDPLTGDGITAGLAAAADLAPLLIGGHPRAAEAYRRSDARRWRRRLLMNRLALSLSSSTRLAARAMRGLARRPVALDRLLELNEGSRSALSLTPADWAALVGL